MSRSLCSTLVRVVVVRPSRWSARRRMPLPEDLADDPAVRRQDAVGGAPLSSALVTLVEDWINAGAQNDSRSEPAFLGSDASLRGPPREP